MKKIASGILAGIAVSIGGIVYLSCGSQYVGAVLFSVALLCICLKGYSLFTGKVGYLPEKHGKEEFAVLFLGLLGNIIGTVACGAVIRLVSPSVSVPDRAVIICNGKLLQAPWQTFALGLFCGMLMYLAVSIYRDKNTVMGILFCIPVFILSGFEHSIADIFYFSAAGMLSMKSIGFILMVILGNSVGAVLISSLTLFSKE